MRHKTFPGLSLAVIFLSSLVLGGPGEFRKGVTYLTPELGVNTWSVPFGLSVEYALTPNIGIGGTGLLWIFGSGGYDYTNVSLFGDFAYHFIRLRARDLDLYAGGGLGFISVSKSKSQDIAEGNSRGDKAGVFLVPFAGVRYYLSPSIALSLRLMVNVFGDWQGVGGLAGVTFVLK
jgi:hypothetical protein